MCSLGKTLLPLTNLSCWELVYLDRIKYLTKYTQSISVLFCVRTDTFISCQQVTHGTHEESCSEARIGSLDFAEPDPLQFLEQNFPECYKLSIALLMPCKPEDTLSLHDESTHHTDTKLKRRRLFVWHLYQGLIKQWYMSFNLPSYFLVHLVCETLRCCQSLRLTSS